ncbi:uncharacterized protein LOC123838502 [Mirounga angustirostris]|uniref:uncharacterized protein LOC123838502 n=1 Tax=Mirounga angustirostris TaxID=9716 RepID=UPI001E6892CC|nr:uncharacterized protein LOC123838502 [Mirounga angustirostris]
MGKRIHQNPCPGHHSVAVTEGRETPICKSVIERIKRGKISQWRPVVTHALIPKTYLGEENVKGFIEATRYRIKCSGTKPTISPRYDCICCKSPGLDAVLRSGRASSGGVRRNSRVCCSNLSVHQDGDASGKRANIRLPPEVNRILYIRNLPYKITAEEMYDIFGKYGPIRQIRVGNTPETRGTAYVVYEDIFDAKNACDHLSGFNVCNRYLVVLYYNANRAFQKMDTRKKEEQLKLLKEKYGINTDPPK